MFSKNPTGKLGPRYSHLVDIVDNKAGNGGGGRESGSLECVIFKAFWFNCGP